MGLMNKLGGIMSNSDDMEDYMTSYVTNNPITCSNSSIKSTMEDWKPLKSRPSSPYIDSDDKICMNHNNVHIQPIKNGFVVTITSDDTGSDTYCFNTFKEALEFLSTLPIMDLDSELVADNV